MHMKKLFKTICLAVVGLIGGCATSNGPSIATVADVNLDDFMGSWYVIAHIPTKIEEEAYNAVETYSIKDDGSIDTVFTFNKGSMNGEAKQYNPQGFVVEGTGNAVWGMQFIWPIKAEYRIAYLTPDYSQTIIARNARDYVWIMARTPTINDADYAKLTGMVKDMGYDLSQLRKVPQQATKQVSTPVEAKGVAE